MERSKKSVDELTSDDIFQVYTGVNGKCCCGCAGTHKYNPRYKDIFTLFHGGIADDEDYSSRSVNRVLNKIKRNQNAIDMRESSFVSAVFGTRLYVAYFAPTDEELIEKAAKEGEWRRKYEAELEAKRLEEVEAMKGAGI